MEWVKLVAVPAYFHDAALLRAGEAAEVLFCRALAHCGSVESKGLVAKTVLPMLVPVRSQQRAEALVREGLWIDEGDHYRIRSWDKWQDAHDAAAHRRASARERKRRERDRKRQEDVTSQAESHPASRVTSQGQSRDVTPLDREGEGEREPLTTSVVTAPPSPKPNRATRVPDDWPAPDDRDRLWQWALDNTPAVAIAPETEQWRDYHRAKGDTARDWNASWRTWMRKAQKDTERHRPSPASRPNPAEQRTARNLALVARFAEQEEQTQLGGGA